MKCPQCGLVNPDVAQRCDCGFDFDSGTMKESFLERPEPDRNPAVTLPLFPVATHKFIILSICSLGVYQLYWCYENWKRLRNASGENLSPFWRALFAPFWAFSLFGRIRFVAASSGLPADWSSGALATCYLVLNATWRLPDPWWLISFASFIPMVPVQQAAQRANERHAPSCTETRNDRYSAANVLTIVIGGLLLILTVVVTLVPE